MKKVIGIVVLGLVLAGCANTRKFSKGRYKARVQEVVYLKPSKECAIISSKEILKKDLVVNTKKAFEVSNSIHEGGVKAEVEEVISKQIDTKEFFEELEHETEREKKETPTGYLVSRGVAIGGVGAIIGGMAYPSGDLDFSGLVFIAVGFGLLVVAFLIYLFSFVLIAFGRLKKKKISEKDNKGSNYIGWYISLLGLIGFIVAAIVMSPFIWFGLVLMLLGLFFTIGSW